MAGFFYICEYLGITPQEFFDADTASPAKANELESEIRKLSPQKAQHVLALIKDLNGE